MRGALPPWLRRGSPPLARGTATKRIKYFVTSGITPACAGNRFFAKIEIFLFRDHPRLRGEQPPPTRTPIMASGSPPLARGTEGITRLDYSGLRITPACAGNSQRFNIGRRVARDHPRLRGEQASSWRRAYRTLGSPPLARGTGEKLTGEKAKRRITPACAGNSFHFLFSFPKVRDHPRLRGEQPFTPSTKPCAEGSPPLARGTELYRRTALAVDRITPACAGNSLC